MIKLLLNKWRNYKKQRALAAPTIEKRFSNIYTQKLWFQNKESLSGSGSTLKATEKIRVELPQLLSKLGGTMLCDVGCGDFNWMKEVSLPCKYIGIDIVKDVIDSNTEKFAKSDVSFLHLNAVEEPIPVDCDIILCREVLFHLSFEDGMKMIQNIVNSNGKYFIVTSDTTVTKNKDIRTGEYRNINLSLPPYNFPPHVEALSDDGVSRSRILAVWNISDLRAIKKA